MQQDPGLWALPDVMNVLSNSPLSCGFPLCLCSLYLIAKYTIPFFYRANFLIILCMLKCFFGLCLYWQWLIMEIIKWDPGKAVWCILKIGGLWSCCFPTQTAFLWPCIIPEPHWVGHLMSTVKMYCWYFLPMDPLVQEVWELKQRGKRHLCCLTHVTGIASFLLWRLLLSTFVQLGSFFTFLDKKDTPLPLYDRLWCSFRLPRAGVNVKNLA